MPFSHLPAFLTTAFAILAHWLHKSSALRLPRLLLGILFASGRRTVTSWFRAADITHDFRPAYTTVCAVGRHTSSMAVNFHLGVSHSFHSGRPLESVLLFRWLTLSNLSFSLAPCVRSFSA